MKSFSSMVPTTPKNRWGILKVLYMSSDALPSHGVKLTWGFHKVKLRKVELGSTLPASNSRKGQRVELGAPGLD